MQQEGKPRFLKYHQQSVRGVAFSPRDRYLFCSGGYDGKVYLYSAMRLDLLMCYQITTMTLARHVNAVRFTSDGSRVCQLRPHLEYCELKDGFRRPVRFSRQFVLYNVHGSHCQGFCQSIQGQQKEKAGLLLVEETNADFSVKILAATTTRRLAVVDVETGQHLLAYDNCAFSGRDRTGLATDPLCPNLAVSVAVNGKGLTWLDLRMPLPLDFFHDLHTGIIRDVTFLHRSWPWGNGQTTLLTAGSDGMVKVSCLDGRVVHSYNAGHQINTICPTPEPYNMAAEDGFYSVVMSGGEMVSAYIPEAGIQEHLKEQKDMPIWKLRYTSNGSTLYSGCEDGVLRRYRRYPDHHHYLGSVFTHKGDIQDLDISPYDEYLVTASKDRSVGVLRLGAPNHGFTEYSELT